MFRINIKSWKVLKNESNNAGMSNDKFFENKNRRKPWVT